MNEERFTGKAGIYGKYRSGYPDELFDYLYLQAGFSKDSVIADIGSGTGIFSRPLLERGSHVFCVEPNDDMRQLAEKDLRDTRGLTNFSSVNAAAENTGLPEKSVDFITAAQAFHWFDRQAFASECRRILKDDGKVVLVWNIRDYDCAIIKKDLIIRKKYCVDTKGLGEAGGPPGDIMDFFTGKKAEEKTFRNDLPINRETYIGLNLSRSYSPKEDTDPEKYHGMVKELNTLFDEYEENGIVSFPQITKSYAGNV